MKPALVDTDIVSLFLRGNRQVVQNFAVYLHEHGPVNISIVTYYEITSGLKHRDAEKQLTIFREFAACSRVLPLTIAAANAAADIYASLRKRGETLDDADLLIAGIAKSHNLSIATRNKRHFDRIEGIEIQDWTAENPC